MVGFHNIYTKINPLINSTHQSKNPFFKTKKLLLHILHTTNSSNSISLYLLMRFSVVKEKILNAITTVECVVGRKESLPILSCVLIDVDKELSIRTTNLEAGVEVRTPCEINEKGSVAVPVTVLSQTLRSIGGEKITFKTDEKNLVVESKGTRTLIKAIPHEEFPVLPGSLDRAKGVVLSRDSLTQGLRTVSYAASPSMIRPELGSVYVSVSNDGITCVATDSFRLAEKKLTRRGKEGRASEILIPLKHVTEIIHILEHSDAEDVSLSAEESQLAVSLDGVQYVSRVIDGTFPNYTEIIPKTFTAEAVILKNDFAEMLKKARVFSGGDQHVGLHLYPKRKIFTATAQSPDVGEMSDSIDAAVSGEDIDINFHIGYLADCLSSIGSDSITLGFAGAGKPLVIRGVSDPTFMYLVMPLNR